MPMRRKGSVCNLWEQVSKLTIIYQNYSSLHDLSLGLFDMMYLQYTPRPSPEPFPKHSASPPRPFDPFHPVDIHLKLYHTHSLHFHNFDPTYRHRFPSHHVERNFPQSQHRRALPPFQNHSPPVFAAQKADTLHWLR